MPSRFGGRKVVEVRETTVEFSRLHCQPARQLQGQTKPPLVFWWASWRHKKSGVVGDSVMLSQNFLRPCNQVSFSQILRLKTGLLIGLLAFKTRFKPTLKNTDCGICCRWFSVQYIQKIWKTPKHVLKLVFPVWIVVGICWQLPRWLDAQIRINFVGRKTWEIFGQPGLPVTRVQIQSIWQVGTQNISTCWMGQVTKERLGRNYVTHVTHGYKIGTGNANTQCELMDNGQKKFTWKLGVHPGKCPAATTFQDGIPFFFYQSCTFKHSEQLFNQFLCRSAQMSF